MAGVPKSAAGEPASSPRRGRAHPMGPAPKSGKAEIGRGTDEPTRPVGRPPARPDGVHRTERTMVRWTPEERAQLDERAAAAGVSVAEYVRLAALADIIDP